jgi:hypothetical protein
MGMSYEVLSRSLDWTMAVLQADRFSFGVMLRDYQPCSADGKLPIAGLGHGDAHPAAQVAGAGLD